MAGPYAPVEASEAQAPRTGLIASARAIERVTENGTEVTLPDGTKVLSGDTRWQGGFKWEPESYCASGGGVVDPCNSGTMEASGGAAEQTYDPVLLWTTDQCSSLSNHRDRIGRARRRLIVCQSKMLANEFWTGELAQDAGFPNRYLASPDSNVVTDGPLAEINALACMEDALAACSCSIGVIHVTPGILTRFVSFRVIERMGNVWRTANDTLVVADVGYDGSGPDGQPATSGSVWMYGTDTVEIRLDDIQTFPSSDSEAMGMTPVVDNQLTYRAECLAAATWDGCCHLAVEVAAEICADLENS